MINNYIIIQGAGDLVEAAVQFRLGDGWDLHGGLIYIGLVADEVYFAQAMTKEESD